MADGEVIAYENVPVYLSIAAGITLFFLPELGGLLALASLVMIAVPPPPDGFGVELYDKKPLFLLINMGCMGIATYMMFTTQGRVLIEREMKNFGLDLKTLASGVAPGTTPGTGAGQDLPNLTWTTINGDPIKLRDESNFKPTVVVFWATWCGPCRTEIPHLKRLHNEGLARVIAVSSEEEKTLRTFASSNAIPYPVISEQNPPAPFDKVRFLPTMFVFDDFGDMKTSKVGGASFEELKKMVEL